MPGPNDTDSYGGWKDFPISPPGTGKWAVSRLGRQWLFVTPEGYGLWMNAIFDAEADTSTDEGAISYSATAGNRIPVLLLKYGSMANWAAAIKKKLTYWGFNTLGDYTNFNLWSLIPFTHIISITINAAKNRDFGSGTYGSASATRDLTSGTPSTFTGWTGSPSPDVYAPQYKTYATGYCADDSVTGLGTVNGGGQLIGIATDDMDFLYGFNRATTDALNGMATFSPQWHIGYLVMIGRPVQAEGNVSQGIGLITYNDPILYSKRALRNTVVGRHGTLSALGVTVSTSGTAATFSGVHGLAVGDFITITSGPESGDIRRVNAVPTTSTATLEWAFYADQSAGTSVSKIPATGALTALNTSWGSSYTTFAEQDIARTGDPWNESRFVDGTAGCNCVNGNTTVTLDAGVRVPLRTDGSDVDKLFKIISGLSGGGDLLTSIASVTDSLTAVLRTAPTVTAKRDYRIVREAAAGFPTLEALWGNGVRLDYSGLAKLTVVAYDSNNMKNTFTVKVNGVTKGTDDGAGNITGATIASGTINYTTGAVGFTFTAGNAPPDGATLTFNYTGSGYGIGTSFLDEDGHNSWMPTNHDGLEPFSGTTSGFRADLDAFLFDFAKQYARVTSTAIKAHFTGHLVFGPVTLGARSQSGAPRKEIYQGLATSFDVFNVQAADQNQLDWAVTYLGDKPFVTWEDITANPDSRMRGNPPGVDPSTPADWTKHGQKQRGQSWQAVVANIHTLKSEAGVANIAGFKWWEFRDRLSESANYGFLSIADNWYDGCEARRHGLMVNGLDDLACGGPMAALMRPRTDRWGWTLIDERTDFGDFMSAVLSANFSAYAAVAANVGMLGTPPPGVIHRFARRFR
jgi:hypothetical protein